MFAAPLGNRERWASIAAVGLGVVIMSILGVVFTVQHGNPSYLFLGLPFSLVLLVIGRYAPSAYRLAADGVHVERRAGPKIIPYPSIRDVDRLPRPLRGLSAVGSRGVFGHFGQFWNSRLGFYRLFLSNRDDVVWLTTTDGLVGVSPERAEEFVAQLRTRLGRSA